MKRYVKYYVKYYVDYEQTTGSNFYFEMLASVKNQRKGFEPFYVHGDLHSGKWCPLSRNYEQEQKDEYAEYIQYSDSLDEQIHKQGAGLVVIDRRVFSKTKRYEK